MTRKDFELLLHYSAKAWGPTGCWKWAQTKIPDGSRERVSVKGRSVLVRRVVYQRAFDAGTVTVPLEEGVPLVNTCGHSDCMNPHHMAPVASARELAARGKAGYADDPRGKHQRAKTHCPSGHPYDATNTCIDCTGRRRCRQCNRIRNSYWRRMHRQLARMEKDSRRMRVAALEPVAVDESDYVPEPPFDDSDGPDLDPGALL